jgi:hypothetical protein
MHAAFIQQPHDGNEQVDVSGVGGKGGGGDEGIGGNDRVSGLLVVCQAAEDGPFPFVVNGRSVAGSEWLGKR